MLIIPLAYYMHMLGRWVPWGWGAYRRFEGNCMA